MTSRTNFGDEMIGITGSRNPFFLRELLPWLLYNALGIPLAVAGMLNPLLAVLAMFASSLTVIGNTLRMSKFLKS